MTAFTLFWIRYFLADDTMHYGYMIREGNILEIYNKDREDIPDKDIAGYSIIDTIGNYYEGWQMESLMDQFEAGGWY
jgi:hypothetical protein